MAYGVGAAPNCGNCENYRERHGDAELLAKAEAAGHPVPPGHCWWLPTPVLRHPGDCCSQHSTMVLGRMQKQAELLADEIERRHDARASAVPPAVLET